MSEYVHAHPDQLKTAYTLILGVKSEGYLQNYWNLAIIDRDSYCIVKGESGHPAIGSGFLVKYDPSYYTIIGIGSDDLETLKLIKELVEKYPTAWDISNIVKYITENIPLAVSTSKKVQEPTQSELQTFAQRQISLNAAKIADLEQQLRDARALQKHLRNVRSGKVS